MLKAQLKLNSAQSNSGQSLIEILIGAGLIFIIVGGAVRAMDLSLRSSAQNKNSQTAISLNVELSDQVSALGEADWHKIYGLSKFPTKHHLVSNGGSLNVSAPDAVEEITVDGIIFSRYFTVENLTDPSSQKITVTTSWNEKGDPATISLNKYITRNKSLIFHQTDWSGGWGQTGPVTQANSRYESSSKILINSPVGSIKKAP